MHIRTFGTMTSGNMVNCVIISATKQAIVIYIRLNYWTLHQLFVPCPSTTKSEEFLTFSLDSAIDVHCHRMNI